MSTPTPPRSTTRILNEDECFLEAFEITIRDDIPKVDDRPTRDPSPPRLPTRWVELPPGSPGTNILDLLDGE